MITLQVIAVSLNTNSFGLRNQIFIGDNGKGYQAAASQLNVRKQGDILEVPGSTDNDVLTFFVRQGFELGSVLPGPTPESASRHN
jgi:hypothetical protein